jgi:hypothetical protein
MKPTSIKGAAALAGVYRGSTKKPFGDKSFVPLSKC